MRSSAPRTVHRLQRLLVPTDFSEAAGVALAEAVRLAQAADAEIHLLHVLTAVEGDAFSPLRYTPEAAVLHEDVHRSVYDLLARAWQPHAASGVAVEQVQVRGRTVSSAVAAYAQREDIDLIVQTSRLRTGLQRLFVDSRAEETVRQAGCPVLTLPPGTTPAAGRPVRVLVPMDFSEAALDALRVAGLLAAEEGRIDLVHVIEPHPAAPLFGGVSTVQDLVPDIRERLQEWLDGLLDRVPALAGTARVVEGEAAGTILEAAEAADAQWVVVGQSSADTHRRRLGRVAERLLRAASLPVLVVPAPSDAVVAPEPERDRARPKRAIRTTGRGALS